MQKTLTRLHKTEEYESPMSLLNAKLEHFTIQDSGAQVVQILTTTSRKLQTQSRSTDYTVTSVAVSDAFRIRSKRVMPLMQNTPSDFTRD